MHYSPFNYIFAMNKEKETVAECGGVPKPKLKEGEYGEYICENGQWVLIPAT